MMEFLVRGLGVRSVGDGGRDAAVKPPRMSSRRPTERMSKPPRLHKVKRPFLKRFPPVRIPGTLLLCLVLLSFGCATTDNRYHGLDSRSRYYRVKEGDTLYRIGQRAGRDYRLIARWNGIPAPFRIVAGQTIRLSPPAKLARKSTKEKTENVISTPAKKKSKKKLKVLWGWPLKGVIAKNYSQSGRKGLDIAGKYGEPVRAAAAGRIVYCGQGLIGYGNLVIVKHNAHFLSAYANNSRLLVREGDYVKMGQPVAEVGMGADKQTVLHFEIRKDGKPVNPIQHLPKP